MGLCNGGVYLDAFPGKRSSAIYNQFICPYESENIAQLTTFYVLDTVISPDVHVLINRKKLQVDTQRLGTTMKAMEMCELRSKEDTTLVLVSIFRAAQLQTR